VGRAIGPQPPIGRQRHAVRQQEPPRRRLRANGPPHTTGLVFIANVAQPVGKAEATLVGPTILAAACLSAGFSL